MIAKGQLQHQEDVKPPFVKEDCEEEATSIDSNDGQMEETFKDLVLNQIENQAGSAEHKEINSELLTSDLEADDRNINIQIQPFEASGS